MLGIRANASARKAVRAGASLPQNGGALTAGAPKTNESRSLWIAVGIFVIAFAARAAHILAIRDSSFVQFPTIDPGAYVARAREILAGKWFPDDVFFQDPLYPYLLAGMYRITGEGKLGPYFIHAAVGALSCVLLYILGKRYISTRAGIVAGLLASVYAPYLYLDAQLEKNTFTIVTLLAFLVAFPRGGGWSFRRVAVAGFFLGCGALLRGNYLLFIPVFAILLLFETAGAAWSKRCAAAALFLASVFAPFAPFTYHNWRASGTFILTTAQSGTAFYLGNNPENVSGGIHAISFNRQIPEFEADDWKREAERRVGRSLTRTEVSNFWFRAALAHVTGDPGWKWWLLLVSKKAELILNRYEIPDNTAMVYVEKMSPAIAYNPIRFATVGPLGIVGVILLAFMFCRNRVVLLALGIYGGSMLLFPVSDRFRAPFAVFFIFGAGAAIDALFIYLKEKNFVRVGMLVFAVSISAVLVNHDPWLQPENSNIQERNAMLKAYHDDASAFINAKKWDRAEAILKEAMLDPWLAKKARLNLDLAMVRWFGHADLAGAKDLVNKSVSTFLKEGISVPDGYLVYAELQSAQGNQDRADYWRARAEAVNANDWNSILQLAKRRADGGETARAMGLLDEFIFADQRVPSQKVVSESYILLARLQLSNGDVMRARDTLQKLAARGGTIPEDLKNFAK